MVEKELCGVNRHFICLLEKENVCVSVCLTFLKVPTRHRSNDLVFLFLRKIGPFLSSDAIFLIEWLSIFSPSFLWFSSPQHVASRYKIYDFLPHKAINQYIIGLNSVRLCCSNQIIPFGTTKSVKSTFFFFFSSIWFFPFSKLHGGGVCIH